MKLFTHPGASSLSVHVLLREIGLPFELEVVNVTAKTRPDGSDYRQAAPRGMVPLLVLDDGTALTENVVIAQFLCDRAERHDLMPAPGTIARYRVMEWQSYVAAELHKSFVPLNWPIDDAMRGLVMDRITGRLAFVERDMIGPFLTGETFTAADAYFFVIASWTRFYGIPTASLPRVAALLSRIADRPSVRAALTAEGRGMVDLSAPVPQP
ncbi:glutathione S-transferase N-terminal domain-containing protein [Sphingomonas sp. S2-65]|uniref:glutathione S-transferase N-terminal domain-containing protein n=1 Tax=Sphingomonas sp. S2-65 TaxID=2903960 RepID=UPI001F217351|nr:glutathione S-transferase N-terminal domain-containing protein [Sphingomonas sp. S2-65]UYY58062.1 glutathione S-transferase N-terminal domain-containing protein [Sphingomonas sp. S2-65]